MRVLITGGAGFIGSNLVKHINRVHPDIQLRVLDDLSTGHAANLDGSQVDFWQGSLLDAELVLRAVAGVDAIVHLAALPSVPRSVLNPMASHEVNVTGTLNVLEAARAHGVRHLSFAGSSSVYGANTKTPKNELDWTRPMSPYAASKLAAEAYVLAYQSTYKLPTLVFRFFNVFGPGQDAGHEYAAVIPKFLEAVRTSSNLIVEGAGTQSRDFTSVHTVCEVITDALNRSVSHAQPINLAFGTNTSILELIQLIETELGHALPVEHSAPRVGDVFQSQADGISVRSVFPSVQPQALVDALQATMRWFGLPTRG